LPKREEAGVNNLDRLIIQNEFLSTLFHSLPCGILVVDEERRVHAVNHPLKNILGISTEKIVGNKTGRALGCVYSSGQECGTADYCQDCEARRAAIVALTENQKYRSRASLQLSINGKIQDLRLLITAAPFQYQGKRYATVILEDVIKVVGRQPSETAEGFRGIVGRDSKMIELFATIREIADSDVSVLILGESGTGKELVARAIHDEGTRADKNFVPVHCAALPEGLLESELFGHVRGAFTGAIRNKKGRFELADGGTLFLDEIGELSPSMQVKLLRVLQEGHFEKVGSEETLYKDVRVISATNKDLEKEVAAGRFRRDLFYRLCVVPLVAPPLRDRASDIPLLAEFFLTRSLEMTGRKNISLSAAAVAVLVGHEWPGNVRELQNAIDFAVIKCQGGMIGPEHFPPMIYRAQAKPAAAVALDRQRMVSRDALAAALDQAAGNKAKAAKLLGVSRATLYRYLADQ